MVTGCDGARAAEALDASECDVKVAILIVLLGKGTQTCRGVLDAHHGNVSTSIREAQTKPA